MLLSPEVVGAVLFGALLHAGWNALLKAGADKALDTALFQLMGSLFSLPLLLWLGWPLAASWPYLLASTVIHTGYYIALTRAYEHGDLGLTYPLMRGTAPLLVALSAGLTLDEHLRPLAWLGVLGITSGVLLLSLSRQALAAPRAVGFALANAVAIAAYTVVDALGARASGAPLRYVLALFVLHGWPFILLVLLRRPGRLGPHARARWPTALGAALASMLSYGIALWAMTQAPVAMVAALRETSVLFAALIGVFVLREGFTRRRLLGTVVMLGGVMALRLA